MMLQPSNARPRSWETVEEKKNYSDLPKFFTFPSKEAKKAVKIIAQIVKP